MTWKEFRERHREKLTRMANRNDGAFTSGDIQLIFDKSTILSAVHLDTLKEETEEDKMILANVIALCGFVIDSRETECRLYEMCDD